MKKRFLLLCLAVLALVGGLLAALYPELPSLVPLHWDGAGAPDSWGARSALFVYPALILGAAALWLVLPALSPRRFSVEAFESTWWFGGMALVALIGYLGCVHLWAAWRPGFAADRALLGGIGLFFLLSGNVMGKVRRNFWFGIRTPWTLANERVWYATHRVAAKSMVLGGALTLVVVLAGLSSGFATGALTGAILGPVAYSLVYYKRLEREGTLEA